MRFAQGLSDHRQHQIHIPLHAQVRQVDGVGGGFPVGLRHLGGRDEVNLLLALLLQALEQGLLLNVLLLHFLPDLAVEQRVREDDILDENDGDLEIARLMASVPDPGVFVLDYAPNAHAPMIKEHGEEFFRILRDAHPDVPVIFIEDVIFPHTLFDSEIRKEVEDKNFEQKALFERLKKQGEKQIYFIPAAKMTEPDGESTADTIHLTDLGMQRYVDLVLPVIRKALRKAKK